MRPVIIHSDAGNIKASIKLPASKSISNRLLVIKSLCDAPFRINNLSSSDDTRILGDCLNNKEHYRVFDVKDAGTPLRFLTAVFALTPGNRMLTGSPRLQERPLAPLVQALNELGAIICFTDKHGFPPLVINGNDITGGSIAIDASISSQFISALLLIAPALPKGIELTLKNNTASVSYIRMTLKLMEHFDIVSKWFQDVITIRPQKYQPTDCTVESDWSAAAFWFEIAALAENANIELHGLSSDSLQGDAAITEIFKNLGVQSTFENDTLRLTKCDAATNFLQYDFFETPDLFPAVVATCAAKNISFRFTGLKNLAIKESDRVKAMVNELQKFGFRFSSPDENTLTFEAGTPLVSAREISCATYNDHRIAMAMAPLSLLGKKIFLDQPSCVSKSYPSYFEDLKNSGFHVKFSENDYF
ncbi:MAG TPA: 3-phosphoshikimate 1-carboxyvinyltransferase [Bacteroidales bacterium]|nr:3-phosphoshikimate 1-carboxyvinyltransferase [Bacteroidales bacterium]HPB24947.1 3-phosphoshikimate 1-carboxyvinyltransferase [Bacteroidales bacterium]HQN16521.1 3-phosphoshikimate 1-carboxyvinyltransferase [Bacteroidales bacterium]HQP14949.1 3-phosphoshikimate 1-carboxyvinyltransferase [Bacteroidales bacterium]